MNKNYPIYKTTFIDDMRSLVEEAAQNFPESTVEAFVDVTELMGAEIYLYLNVGKSEEGDGKIKIVNDGTNLIARVSSRSTSRAGDTIKVAFDTSRIHIFDKDTERCVIH